MKYKFSNMVQICLLFCLFLAISVEAGAQISIQSAIAVFRSGSRPFMDVAVTNTSDKPMRVMAELTGVTNPYEESESVESSQDIVVAPKRLSVPEKGQRNVRLLLRKPPSDTERMYRLAFYPQGNDVEGEKVKEDFGRGKSAVINVVTTVGMLIFVEPVKVVQKFDWTVDKEKEKVVFRNDGNIQVKFHEMKTCSAADPNDCGKITTKRIFPGKQFETNLEKNRVLKIRRSFGEEGEQEYLEIPYNQQ